jgi:hypothetical protein
MAQSYQDRRQKHDATHTPTSLIAPEEGRSHHMTSTAVRPRRKLTLLFW